MPSGAKPKKARLAGQKKTRQRRPVPAALYSYEGILEIPEKTWTFAESKGQLKKGKRFRIKHTEQLREDSGRVLAALHAELVRSHCLPSAARMRERHRKFERAITRFGEAMGYLSEDTAEAASERRALQTASLWVLQEYREREKIEVLVTQQARRIERLIALLRSASQRDEVRRSIEIARSIAQQALKLSKSSLPPGQDANLIKPYLRDLAWIYTQAGGGVTKGNENTISPFARWAFVLLTCLPKKGPGDMRRPSYRCNEINDIVRNWKGNVSKPAYLEGPETITISVVKE